LTPLINLLIQKTGIAKNNIESILKLLEEGSTIPFIARYRKEMTGGATDEQLREFETLYAYSKKLLERKEEVRRLIQERGVLSTELSTLIDAAQTLQVLEDIYRPFKEKKNTRAASAITAGLEPLADILQSGRLEFAEFKKRAQAFVKGELLTVDEAVQGAKDILAERYSDDPREREHWRKQLFEYSSFEIKGTKTLKEDGLFAKLAGKAERISSIPSHRYLAMMRGVAEKELSVKISHDMERVESSIKQ
jgi:uncharacterized protein